jgi:trk system potassium uptake protein TrkA
MKTYLIIGLGRFGSSAAEKLYDMGHEVLVIDEDEEVVRQAADQATHGAIGDAREMAVLKAAGAKECDCAIVAIGDDLAASIVITMNLKDLGVPYIICKARDEMYKRALERIGADRVVIPEKEMARRLVQSLGSTAFLDYMEFSEEYGIAEISAPKNWQGKSLKELNVRGRYRVNVLSINHGQNIRMSPGAEDVIGPEDTVMVMGKNEDLALLQR